MRLHLLSQQACGLFPSAQLRIWLRHASTCLLFVAACLFLAFFRQASPSWGADLPLPPGLLKQGVSLASSPDALMASLLGTPYRNDGTIDEYGRYTLFAAPERIFTSPGLNCSGLTLQGARLLLRKNFTLAEVTKDRLGDSGPNAAKGEDWDFGWDLIMNISEGFSRTLLLPGGKTMDPSGATGSAPRGYDLHADATWAELPGRLRQGHLYLASINVEGRRKGYGLVHYHVGLIHMDNAGKAWFYQTTSRGKSANRRDLNSESGRTSLKKSFADRGNERRMLLVLEVELPASLP